MMLHDKGRFHEFATANGFPVPQAEVVRRPEDILLVRELRFPVIIKPADKRNVHVGRAPRVVVANDWESAERSCQKLHEVAGDVIVQERVEGPDNAIYLPFLSQKQRRNGDVHRPQARKHPAGVGNTAYCTGAKDVRGLEEVTQSILERVDFVGFGSIEYKWDPASERFVIIEPTVGRTNWQEEIATLSGMNLPLVGYCYECGLPPPIQTPPERPVVWRASYVERMKVGVPVVPPGSVIADGYWRRNDPLPAIVHYPKDFAMSAPLILYKCLAQLRQWGHLGMNRLRNITKMG